MFVSTIVPTVGRAVLERAVESVLAQELAAEFEVIVVNDSGAPLRQAKWQSDPRVRIVTTRRRERCIARNTGAALASGRYLHFLDDDDWLVPDALASLKRATDRTSATWIYGGSQLVDRKGNKLIELHHGLQGNCLLPVMAGEWIPLQSSLFDSGLFFALGGFNPLIPGAEDVDWIRRVAAQTDIVGIDEVVSCIGMGTEGSTTDTERSRGLIRTSREAVLDQTGIFGRLQVGATNSYWFGRLLRIYVTSALWHAHQREMTTAMSRLAFGLWALTLTGVRALHTDFWLGFFKAYRNSTFDRGFQALRTVPEANRAQPGSP